MIDDRRRGRRGGELLVSPGWTPPAATAALSMSNC
jgi:hypothetical protein